MENYDARPGGVGGEIDEETKTEGHEEEAEVDWGKVLASFADEDTSSSRHEGEGENEGEEVDAG